MLACSLLLGACASTDSVSIDKSGRTIVHGQAAVKVLWQVEFGNVLLVSNETGAPANDHPFNVNEEQMMNLLLRLKMVHADEPSELMFTREEARQLGSTLAAGLSQAKPGEEVTFVYPQRRKFGVLFERNYATTGRVFYRDGKLNLIFGLIMEDYEGMLFHTNFMRDLAPGSRARSLKPAWDVVVNDIFKYADSSRKDWIAFDPRDALRPPGAPRQAPAPMGLQERLQRLEKMKQDGLLTEEEYQAQRSRVLQAY